MTGRKETTAIALHRRMFWGLIAILVSLSALYGYFVSSSIANVLIREEIEQELAMVSSEISDFEFTYLELKNSINLEFAYTQGFSDVKDKKFVARKDFLGKRLTLNNEI